jgi:hypothetical protein
MFFEAIYKDLCNLCIKFFSKYKKIMKLGSIFFIFSFGKFQIKFQYRKKKENFLKLKNNHLNKNNYEILI